MRIRGRAYPVVLPAVADPRLQLAAVIISLQILGQTVLGFELSIAQILVSVLTCAALEIAINLWRRRILLWPASALLTGNGIAFILRVPGTRHGDWWSLHGAWIFAAAASISLLSKYVIRAGDRHVFNPSNFGLVVILLVLGTRLVNPQDLWWGPMSPGLALTLAVIVTGGLVIVTRLRMLGVVAAFWATFALCIGLLSASGHCMTARWHVGQVCGGSFWSALALSPEILVFAFFMITDPRTSPGGRLARLVYGAGVAFTAALLVAPSRSEFSTKLGVLAGLALVCAARPMVAPLLAAREPAKDRSRSAQRWHLAGRGVLATGVATLAASLVVAAGVRARPAAGAVQAAAARPAVPLVPIPYVLVDPAAHRLDASISAQVAQRMGQDLAADIQIAAMALRSHNGALAAAAGTGHWLASVDDLIRSGISPVLPAPLFDRMTVVVVPNPGRPQDSAKIGLAVHGAYDGTFELTIVGDHYLISESP